MLRLVTRALVCAALPCCALIAAVSPAAALAHPAADGGAGVAAIHHHHHGVHHQAAQHALPALSRRVLRRGMHGEAVRALQRALSRAGYPTAPDGRFGRRTEAHLRAFERARGLPATGTLTHRAGRALMRARGAATGDSAVPQATIGADGELTLPAGAPAQVQRIVAAANQIIDTSYRYGGGHASYESSAYDCSGAVSYALHGGGLVAAPEDSSGLESFGASGPGRWVTVYADAGHAFAVVAGRAFDTADFGGPNIPGGSGPRWRSDPTGNLADHGSYVVRHPAGL